MTATARSGRDRVRVVQLADLVNRYDFIDAIIEHADRECFDVRVATFTPESNIADPAFTARGVDVIDLGAAPGRRSYPAALRRLASYLRRERIDVVHTHHFDPAVVGWLASRLAPTRLVVGRHYSDAIHLSTSGAKRSAYLAIERRVQRSAAAVVVPSQMIARLVMRSGIEGQRVHIIPYAVMAEKYQEWTGPDLDDPRKRVGLPSSAFLVGTFARLYRDKGHRYLLEAIGQLVNELPELLWLVVGDGAERDSLERSVDQAGLRPHVQFTGWRLDAMALMAGVDIVVQPTLQEAFSSVMGEAMWLRRALIITDVSGATDIIDGENGLIVPKRDPGALADAIRRLAADRRLREAMGQKGHAFVTTQLAAERVVPRYERVYRAVAGIS